MASFPDIALDGIKYRAQNLKLDANEMTTYVGILNAVPDFHTLAEACLKEADEALAEALQVVRDARERFDSLRAK